MSFVLNGLYIGIGCTFKSDVDALSFLTEVFVPF